MDQDEISLKELFDILWREKWLIISVTCMFAIVAAAAAWIQPKKYLATVTISPVSTNSTSSRLGGIASQFGGLAALAGISVGEDTDKVESMAVLQSRALTSRYIQQNDLLPVLFAGRWDASNSKWKEAGDGRAPTLWEANKMFEGIRKVVNDKKTGLMTLTISWVDPVIAAKWANDLVSMTNDYLRDKAIRESERHISYLNEQAANTDIAQVRTAIYAVLESEIKNVMLAKGPGDFALKVIDPAVPPERASSPKKLAWLLAGTFCGFLFSLMIIFVRTTWRAGRAST